MEQISKKDLKRLKEAKRYLLKESNPTFNNHSFYQDLFLKKSIEYNVGLQELHDHITI